MRANAEIYDQNDRLTPTLAWSVGLHAALFGSLLLYGAVRGGTGQTWGGSGGGGGAMSANIVSSIPLPRSVGTNVLAVESKGLSYSQPKPKVEETEAIPIPARDAKEKPRPTTSASRQPPPQEPEEVASNVVPFGQGGPVSGPYGAFSAGGAKGGFGFTGGGGDFGSRYSWYVDVVRKKVAENWLKYEIDPAIGAARRVYITFEINRAGRPENVEISQSSGVPSLDQSAVRALKRIDTFGPLPSDYAGNRVSVEFWFDYKR